MRIKNRRALRQGALATAVTVVVVAVIVLLNLVVTRLGERYTLRLDMTAAGVFTMSGTTARFLDGLDKDVAIYILNNKETFTSYGTYVQQAAEIIDQYARRSQHIKVSYVDLMRDPGLVNAYAALSPQADDILVVCGGNVRLLTLDDLFNYGSDSYGYYIASSRAEEAITSAVSYVSAKKTVKAAVLGAGSSTLQGLSALLSLNNYDVVNVSLSSQSIPGDVDAAMLSAPRADLTAKEIEELTRFLYNGGSYGKTLFYLAGIDQLETPALDSFLAEWGIAVGDSVVFESDYNMLAGASIFLTNVLYAEDVYAKDALRSGRPVSMANGRPLLPLDVQNATVQTLLSYSRSAGLRPLDAGDEWQPSAGDVMGEMPALLLSQKSGPQPGSDSSAVLAASSSLAVEQEILATQSFANSTYFISLLDALTGRQSGVVIESKAIGAPMLDMSYGQAVVWGGVFFIGLPLAVLAVGGFVFIRRRYL